MKKTHSRRVIVFATVVGASLTAGALYSATRASSIDDIRQRQEAAFRIGGFPAAAAITGTYERTQSSTGRTRGLTPEQLVRSGEVIVVGEVLSNRGVLSPSGQGIRTHYQVRVLSVLKGREGIPRDRDIVVSILGGRAALEGGGWAQLNVRYADPPLNGHRYLLVLNRVPSEAQGVPQALDTDDADFWPANGPIGIVGLGRDGNALKVSDRRSPNARNLDRYGGNGQAFVREIRELARTVGQ